MITAERVRMCHSADSVVELVKDLGYPTARVPVDESEWQRGGVVLPWRGARRLERIVRLERLDLFLLNGAAADEDVSNYLHSYRHYNQLIKSALINYDHHSDTISIYDMSDSGSLRRLRISTARPSAHAVDRLNLLAAGDGRSPARVFDLALDRERITRQFFIRFRSAVREVADGLEASCPGDAADDVLQEALLLLSRLLFLCFIQEKGWLAGERRFLVDRATRAEREGSEFFAGVLLPLFFGCLNTPIHERNQAAAGLGRVPYLNGGLFEPSPFERRHPELHLSNSLMRHLLEDVFEKFDFSVDENDAAGAHVDPEMLGKVFESLMAEEERAQSGSFYTPREIVDVLARRAIIERLSGGDDAMREVLAALASGADAALDIDSAQDLLARIDRITVLDPACGSGAFLLSALTTLERLARRAAAVAGEEISVGVRQRIVERSLYGVDLKPEAVRLCELRLWLAIVSRSDATIETVAPLPNLDRNILQGNSLLSPIDFLGGHRGDIYAEWALAIRSQSDLIGRYRNAPRADRPALQRMIRANDRRLASELLQKAVDADEAELASASLPRRDLFGDAAPVDLKRCRELQARIASSRSTLQHVEAGELDFFSFDVHFAHVTAAGGFDVVIGNPPWVRTSRIDPALRAMLRERYRLFGSTRNVPFHQPDLSLAFYERACGVAAPDAVIAMLLPAKIQNAAYAAPLRKFVRERQTIINLTDWSDEPRQHFKADTFPLGLTIRCSPPQRGQAISVNTYGASFSISGEELQVEANGSEWALLPPEVRAILSPIRERCQPLERALGRKPTMGVKTGDNATFFLEGEVVRGSLVTSEGIAIPLKHVCRCVRGRDVRRWATAASSWLLWPPVNGWREVEPWLARLAAARGIAAEEMRLTFVRPEHIGIKVAWKDVSRGMAAVVLPDRVDIAGHSVPLVPNQTLYSLDAVSLDEAWLIAALLNSTVADALLLSVAERAKDCHYRYFGRTVARMPFPGIELGGTAWQSLVRASRAAHRGNASADLERLVASVYGISNRELETLQSHVHRRLGAR